MTESLEKEFLDFLEKKGGAAKRDEHSVRRDEPSCSTKAAAASSTAAGGGDRRRGGGGGDPSSSRTTTTATTTTATTSTTNGGVKNDRRALMTKSLSKEDLNVELVNDFFADDEGFAVDWEDPSGATTQESEAAATVERPKAHLARSRRLGPGDRRKELMRRNSSRRLCTDSGHESSEGLNRRSSNRSLLSSGSHHETHEDDHGSSSRRGLNRRSSNRSLLSSGSHEKQQGQENEEDVGSSNRRGLNRRSSNRSLLSSSSHGKKPENNNNRNMFAEFAGKSSSKTYGDIKSTADQSAPSNNTKLTVKSLKEDLKDGTNNDMEMSFSELPKEWKVSSNPAVASFLPSQRLPNRSKSSNNNPRHRRNSLNGANPRPQLQRRLSSRGGSMLKEEVVDQRRTPRRHSLMGEVHQSNTDGGMHRQRSTRVLNPTQALYNGNDPQTSSSRRTTTVPRRMSTGGNQTSCRDLGVSGSRPPVVTNTSSLTGETIAAMGGATIRW